MQDLKDRYYVLHTIPQDGEPEERFVVPFINVDVCDKILSGKYFINVHYGTILRGREGNFVLSTKWAHRSVGSNSWWKGASCPRELRDEEGYLVTKCKGYQYKEIDPDTNVMETISFVDDGQFTILSDILGE